MMTAPTTSAICPEVIFTPSDDDLGALKRQPKRTPPKRKFSFPASLHSSTLLLTSESNALGRTTRRLSNVSDRVSDRVRKLSSAIGWTKDQPSKDLLISQAKILITLYIRFRLRRSGILSQQKKKVNLQKISTLGIGVEVKDAYMALKEAALVLEAMHGKVYTNVSRQISNVAGGELESADDAAMLLGTFARMLFKSDVTWAKVVSLFCVTAGLSLDLVRQNHDVSRLIEGFLGVVEDELITWLTDNHGWLGLHNKLQDKKGHSPSEWSAILVLLMIIMLFFIINGYLLKF